MATGGLKMMMITFAESFILSRSADFGRVSHRFMKCCSRYYSRAA